jgi:hypothetical protein
MNTAKIVILLVFLGFLATSCFSPPTYPDTPEIGFEAINNVPANNSDSVFITISYKDGDGDLGLNSTDDQPPFQATNTDGTPNPFYNNFYLNIYKRINGRYVPVRFTEPTFSLNGRYPRLNDTRKSAIEGTLKYSFLYFYVFPDATTPRISRNDTIKFDVQIVDRALNKSNIVETSEIIIGRKN